MTEPGTVDGPDGDEFEANAVDGSRVDADPYGEPRADADGDPAEEGPVRQHRRAGASVAAGLLWFLGVITLWTVGLSLLFLAAGWPRWGFYTVLLLGAAVFSWVSPILDDGRERD